MTTDQCEGNLGVRRGFGFDIESAYSAPRALFSRSLDTRRTASRSGSTRRWTPTWRPTKLVHPDGHKDLKAFRSSRDARGAAIRRR